MALGWLLRKLLQAVKADLESGERHIFALTKVRTQKADTTEKKAKSTQFIFPNTNFSFSDLLITHWTLPCFSHPRALWKTTVVRLGLSLLCVVQLHVPWCGCTEIVESPHFVYGTVWRLPQMVTDSALHVAQGEFRGNKCNMSWSSLNNP